ncbi:hypothetical protein [Shouchella shacheensis]|uniref:hypothetical protein n=1 Tax=Shouchella shacheensis TaxID=1649580 RepID=UPI00074021E0|nr:hypothetical protein [Shouchella shacheensis]
MAERATQRCIEVRQEIGWIEKRVVETSFDMKLFDDRIEVKNDAFPIDSVFDISYRMQSGDNNIGFMYLHTSQGVRTYNIKIEPHHFIDEFKKIVPPTTFND